MKTIKLYLALFLIIGITSCGSDDDDSGSNSPEADRIVGEWIMERSTFNGEVYTPDECEAQSTLEFFANGTVTYVEFWEDWETEECISESDSEEWEYRGNNVYRFTGDDDEPYDVLINFSNNNNTFTVTEEDEDGTYTAVYNRV